MADFVRRGTRIRFDVSGAADGWDGDSARSMIVSELGKYFRVQSVTLTTGGSFAEYFGWPFRADVTVTTTEDYGESNDVSSIVAHAVYNATGYMPTVSIPSLGQPEQGNPDSSFSIPSLEDIGTAIGDAIRGATAPATEELNKVLIIVAVVAVVLIIGVAGKTTRFGVAT